MEIAKRVHALAQEQNDAALMIGAYRALADTLYFLGNFESARKYAAMGVQIWRSGSIEFSVEEVTAPVVTCLWLQALCDWQFGEIAASQATLAEAITLAQQLNDMHGLASALAYAGMLGSLKRDAAEVDRVASDLIELSTRHLFAQWLAAGQIFRGWSRSVTGDPAQGISWIQDGIEGWRALGTTLSVPFGLALKAEALHLADRMSEALEAITEAEALVARTEERWWSAELHRLRGVFLAASGADDTQIEAAFRDAIHTAKQQKSVSLATRAEATYAEYSRQKASASEGHGFRLPLA